LCIVFQFSFAVQIIGLIPLNYAAITTFF